MVKAEGKKLWKTVLLTVAATLFVLLVLLPLSLSLFDGSKYGNVALIKIQGVITSDGAGSFGDDTISSTKIVEFIQDAEENSQIKAIVLEINSPGGSPVASDEIGTAVKKAKKRKSLPICCFFPNLFILLKLYTNVACTKIC